jgi:hypothetical protein
MSASWVRPAEDMKKLVPELSHSGRHKRLRSARPRDNSAPTPRSAFSVMHARKWRFLVRRRVVPEWLAPPSIIPGTRTKLGAPAGFRPAGCFGNALGLDRVPRAITPSHAETRRGYVCQSKPWQHGSPHMSHLTWLNAGPQQAVSQRARPITNRHPGISALAPRAFQTIHKQSSQTIHYLRPQCPHFHRSLMAGHSLMPAAARESDSPLPP